MCGIPLTEGKQAGDQRRPVGLQTQLRQGESGNREGEGCPSHKGECIWTQPMFWDVRQRQFGQCFGRHETGASGHSLL